MFSSMFFHSIGVYPKNKPQWYATVCFCLNLIRFDLNLIQIQIDLNLIQFDLNLIRFEIIYLLVPLIIQREAASVFLFFIVVKRHF